VPATPDPYDDTVSEVLRRAVLDLLPPRTTPPDGERVPEDGTPVSEATAEAVDASMASKAAVPDRS
jgi:hypothetical protein